MVDASVRDIRPDDGKVARIECPNIRASIKRHSSCTVGVGVWAESAEEHERLIFHHHAGTVGEHIQKSKKKIPAIAGLVSLAPPTSCDVVAASLAHRKPLAEAIRRYRKKAALTQEKLGELADLNPKYIGEVERMEKTISVDALVRVSKALKVRLKDLVREV